MPGRGSMRSLPGWGGGEDAAPHALHRSSLKVFDDAAAVAASGGLGEGAGASEPAAVGSPSILAMDRHVIGESSSSSEGRDLSLSSVCTGGDRLLVSVGGGDPDAGVLPALSPAHESHLANVSCDGHAGGDPADGGTAGGSLSDGCPGSADDQQAQPSQLQSDVREAWQSTPMAGTSCMQCISVSYTCPGLVDRFLKC